MKRVYIVKLTPTGGADGIRALRALLKSAGRRWGLRCVHVATESAGGSDGAGASAEISPMRRCTSATMGYDECVSKILEAVKAAIEASDESLRQIGRGSGVSYSAISRLMSGERSLGIDRAEMLADYLGLEITIKAKKKGRR